MVDELTQESFQTGKTVVTVSVHPLIKVDRNDGASPVWVINHNHRLYILW